MKKQIDWNCKLLPGFPDQIGSLDDAIAAMEVLHSNSGITDFAFFPKYDPAVDAQAFFRLRANAALNQLQQRLPFSANLFVRPAIYLRPELPEPSVLRHFCIPKTNYLAFSLPISPEEDTEKLLAKTARHLPFQILLLDAQLLPIFYPKEVLERILELPGIALQASFQSLCTSDFAVFLRKIRKKGIPVVLGSGVNSIERANRLQYQDVLQMARKKFTEWDLERLFVDGLPHSQ